MRVLSLILGFVCFCFISCINSLTNSNTEEVNVKQIQRVNKKITVNGNLFEWDNVNKIYFVLNPNHLYKHPYVQALWDDTNLYIAYYIIDKNLNATKPNNSVGIYTDDCIEFYISTSPKPNNQFYLTNNEYQFLVNLKGFRYSICGKHIEKNKKHYPSENRDFNWNKEFCSAVYLSGTLNNNTDTDSYYCIEMAIKWATINYTPKVGNIISVDFVVNDNDGDLGNRFFDWSSLSFFAQPSKWNKIMLVNNTTTQQQKNNSSKNFGMLILIFSILTISVAGYFMYFKMNTKFLKNIESVSVSENESESESESNHVNSAAQIKIQGSNYKKGKAQKVQQIIEREYYNNISIESVANELSISVRQLQRIIKEIHDTGFTKLLNSYRLKKSCDLLLNTDLTIGQISQNVGFENQSHFHSLFKSYFGVSPAQFRTTGDKV